MRVPALPVLFIALCNACSSSGTPQNTDAVSTTSQGAPANAQVSTAAGGPSTAPQTQSTAPKASSGAAGTAAMSSNGASTAMSMTAAVGSAGMGIPAGALAAGSGGMVASTAAAGTSAAAAGASAGAGASQQQPVQVGHPQRFLASIHGNADKLQYVDVADPKQNWSLDVPDGIQDFQLIGNNKLLVGYKFNFGYMEVDLATHKVDMQVRDFLTRQQAILTSVKRLANGHTLIMGQGMQSSPSDLEVWEVDNTKMVYEKRTIKSCCGNLRVVRMTSDGHFLVGSDSALIELDPQGKELARMTTGGSPTYMGLKTADGSYYATNGHGGQIVSFAAGGGQKKVLGGKMSSSASKVTIYQPGQFQILQNGNVVITNWTAEDGGMGKQLVEYDPQGNMVWSWDDPMVRPQGMETLIVLDNLDPMVLNDDRDGVLKPVH